MVRARQYHGHPAELHDPGNVSALWEHRLLVRPMSNTAGTRNTRAHTHTFSRRWGKLSWGCVCVWGGIHHTERSQLLTFRGLFLSIPSTFPSSPPPPQPPMLWPVIPGSDPRLACALCAAAGVAFSHTPPKQLSPSSATVQKSLLTHVRVGVALVHKHVRVPPGCSGARRITAESRCSHSQQTHTHTTSHSPKSTRQIDSAPWCGCWVGLNGISPASIHRAHSIAAWI